MYTPSTKPVATLPANACCFFSPPSHSRQLPQSLTTFFFAVVHSFSRSLDCSFAAMAASKLLNLLAVTSLAVLATTFNAQPVTALSHAGSSSHLNRIVPGGHEAIARRKKRGANGLCKPRSSSSVAAAAQTSAATNSGSVGNSVGADAPATTSTPPPPPPTTSVAPPLPPTTSASPTSASAPASTGSAGTRKVGISWNSENNPASLANVVSSNTG